MPHSPVAHTYDVFDVTTLSVAGMSSLFSGLDAFGKETSILNQFLFPAPRTSYSWASFPGELVCVVGREGNTVPCTLMPGVKTAQQTGSEQQYEYREQPASCLVLDRYIGKWHCIALDGGGIRCRH